METSTGIGTACILFADDLGQYDLLFVHGVLLSSLFHFSNLSLVGKSPGGGEFFRFAEDISLRGNEIEVITVVSTAKTLDVVHVILTNGQPDALSIVKEFDFVKWGPEPDFTAGHSEDL